jgi:N-acetylglucosaminyldiphosphoundecaprenol N-acetyl-beta-D-mannosaminyltransferase
MKQSTGEWLNDRGAGDGGEAVCFDGLRIWGGGAKRFIGELVRRARSGERTLACYLNAHTYNLSCRDEDYRTIFSQAEILYPDGMSVVWAVRLLCGAKTERMTGVDFFEDFLRISRERGLKLYFLGSRPGVADRVVEALAGKYEGLKIVGRHHGYLEGSTQESEVLADINVSGVDILLVGMGSPGQEKFAWRNREALDVPVIWTVGALFDYYAGEEKAAPRWLAGMGFEWLYRLCRDPKGKWRRYLIGNWRFAWRVFGLGIRQLIFGKRNDDGCDRKNNERKEAGLG